MTQAELARMRPCGVLIRAAASSTRRIARCAGRRCDEPVGFSRRGATGSSDRGRTGQRRQPAFGDLVKEALVAELEDPSRLGAIPGGGLEHVLQRLSLGFTRCAARDLPQTVAVLRSG